MYPLLFTGGIVLLWVSALLNGTGLGMAYQTDQITFAVLGVLSLLLFLKNRVRLMPLDLFRAFGGMTAVFLASALLHGFAWSAVKYFSCFLMVYIVSNIRISQRAARLAGLAVLVLGTAVLVIFDYGSELSGWNGNSVAMIGLFSYLLFAAAFWDERSPGRRLLLLLTGGAEFWLILPTDSRSCQAALLIMGLLLLLRTCPGFLRSPRRMLFALLLPLAVAAGSALLSSSGLAGQLDAWSSRTFRKPIFNGRDETWRMGFQLLWQHPLFGNGNIDTLRWHNAALACLVSFGGLGYAFWIAGLYGLLKRGMAYLADPVVCGCMISFLLMHWQQAVELGMMTQNPNLLIYLPLGLMLGRIRSLKGCGA